MDSFLLVVFGATAGFLGWFVGVLSRARVEQFIIDYMEIRAFHMMREMYVTQRGVEHYENGITVTVKLDRLGSVSVTSPAHDADEMPLPGELVVVKTLLSGKEP